MAKTDGPRQYFSGDDLFSLVVVATFLLIEEVK